MKYRLVKDRDVAPVGGMGNVCLWTRQLDVCWWNNDTGVKEIECGDVDLIQMAQVREQY